MLVDLRVEESGESTRSAHGVVEDGTHGHTDHAGVGGGVGPVGSGVECVVEDFEHVVIVADLLVAGGVPVVGFLVGNFGEHGVEPHVYAGSFLDEVLEVFQCWGQFFGVCLCLLDLAAEPFFLDSVVCWEPGSCSVWL